MRAYRWYAVAARLAVLSFSLVSSVYALLAFIPFTYHQVILSPLMGWQQGFVRHFPLIVLSMLVVAGTALLDELRAPRTRALTAALLVVWTGASVALFIHNVYAALELTPRSFLWAHLALIPPLWIALIDLVAASDLLARDSDENDSRFFIAALLSAGYITLFYAALQSRSFALSGTGPSLAAHLLAFTALFLILSFLRTVVRSSERSVGPEFFLMMLGAAFLFGLAMLRIVFVPISFTGRTAVVFSFVFAAVAALSFGGAGLRRARGRDERTWSGFDLLIGAIPTSAPATLGGRVAALAVLVGFSIALATRAAVVDWDFLLQKLAALAIALAAFVTFHGVVPGLKRERQALSAAVALVVLGGWVTASRGGAARVVEEQANVNPSFRLIQRAVTPEPPHDQMAFYRFLQKSTNIGRDIDVKPVETRLPERAATSAVKPDIFVFVIDSLRRDYVSPYNPSVSFTPSIASLARDSVVFDRAFTHYGGTGLSEPSIWTGALMLHKQYVTPFFPMNELQKLLDADGYRMYLSFDSILRVIVEPSPDIVPLEPGGINYDFCRSVTDLEKKLGAAPAGRPLFAYIQPQNIHIATVNREGAKPIDEESYGGFYAPYASRLRRIDQCLGGFIGFLRERNLYDSSVIVVTSDHGDSLGEDGRWGHAYTIYPEVLRVPLIVHLPAEARQTFAVDPKQTAFLTDITPTLAWLLGYRNVVFGEMFGHSLLREPSDRSRPDPSPRLVASSYGPVYGSLSADGSLLYIADALNFRDVIYEMGSGNDRIGEVTSTVRAANQNWIRKQVEAIDRYYRFDPK
jgi:Sulfatase